MHIINWGNKIASLVLYFDKPLQGTKYPNRNVLMFYNSIILLKLFTNINLKIYIIIKVGIIYVTKIKNA